LQFSISFQNIKTELENIFSFKSNRSSKLHRFFLKNLDFLIYSAWIFLLLLLWATSIPNFKFLAWLNRFFRSQN